MASTMNKAIVMGYVGKDPKVTEFTNGKVEGFTIATTMRGYRNKMGVDVPERTDWHNIVAYGTLADIVQQYVAKGSYLLVVGRMQTRSYDDTATGTKRYVTEVVADEIHLLDRKQEQKNDAQIPNDNQFMF